jgi:1-acyl-sn-glycerol-3-phosphate acyltransferase
LDIYYNTAKAILRLFHLVLMQDCRVEGKPDLPPGRKIIAGNHPNATDGFFLPFIFPERLYFFVQGDLFTLPFFGWLLAKADQIPVIPGKKHEALEKAARLLGQEKTVALFPEATLNPDGKTIKSGTGAVRLSLMTNAPIIPVGFYVPSGNLHYFERNREGRRTRGHWQMRGHCYLHIGAPWMPAVEAEGSPEVDSARVLTERLMDRIQQQAQLAMQAFTKETGLPADQPAFR